MPLFKKNHDETTGNTTAGLDGNTNANNQRYDGTQNNLASNPGAGVGTQHHHHDPLYPSPNVPTTTQSTAQGGQFDNSNNGGYGAQPGTGASVPGTNAQSAARPHTDAAGNPINSSHSSGGGKRMEGKIERVVGTIVGSESLKAKGLAKEQEAAELKFQASELSEAERLEQGAHARRERAVAHGAHPDHLHLGDHNPGAGASSVNDMGNGAGYGVTGAGGASSAARGGY